MASRELNDWLSGYIEYTDNTEPPLSYHVWTGVSLIAAALQRKVFIDWGHETLYPNLYIVLIGPSGKCRKGTAMTIGQDILRKITKISVTSEAITREALIRAMKNATDNIIDPNNPSKIRYHCSLTAFSEELSVFLGQNDIKFLSNLTAWYDSRDRWTYETKGSGTDAIQGVCFNLLGATAPDWLQSILPTEAIGGGFTSRIIFIVEEDKAKTVPSPVITQREYEIYERLVNDLERINTIVGRMDFSDEAKEIYINWYEEQDIKSRQGNPAIRDPRFAGYCERRATHIRKLSMIMSASRTSDQIIIADDFERAHKLLKSAEVNMVKVFSGLGAAKYSQVMDKIIKYIADSGQVKRSELLRTFYRDLDSETLTIIEDTLIKMKVIKMSIDPQGGEATYIFQGWEEL